MDSGDNGRQGQGVAVEDVWPEYEPVMRSNFVFEAFDPIRSKHDVVGFLSVEGVRNVLNGVVLHQCIGAAIVNEYAVTAAGKSVALDKVVERTIRNANLTPERVVALVVVEGIEVGVVNHVVIEIAVG